MTWRQHFQSNRAMEFEYDRIVFAPPDVDLARSPMRPALAGETYVLGAFNPGLTRLPGGNLLMMVRVAEALKQPVKGDRIHALRWDPVHGYVTDPYDLADVEVDDPRKFRIRGHSSKVMALTSLSWLLPVELSRDGSDVTCIHYDKAIAPATRYQEYGIEDARISVVDERYYMTTCCVSAERHSTVLYTSDDGLNYRSEGIVLDHQNKDMLIFEGKISDKFHALTRPLGDLYFAYPPGSAFEPGPSINLASSPDARHWKPSDEPFIRPRRGSSSVMRIGGGTPPIRTPAGWLMLYHGVQPGTLVGTYRTFHAFLDHDDPGKILALHDTRPLLEPKPELTEHLKESIYLTDIVFTTGIVEAGDHFLVASGENDLACRLTRIPKQDLGLDPS